MRVSDIEVVEGPEGCELRARLRFQTHWVWGDEPFPLWYRFPADWRDCLRADNGDPFLALGLAPAMLLGEPLEIPAPVSARLLQAVPQIQTILRCWEPRLQEVPVRAVPRAEPLASLRLNRGVGLFFSLGVDSSYSLAKNLQTHPADAETLTHLVSVLGFDVYLWEQERYGPIRAGVERVARELNKQPLFVATNLREVSDRLVDWPLIYHGAALASVALAVAPGLRQMHIAASGTYAELHVCGTHPLLDPLWSTETLAFVHDGCEADRLEKIRRLAQSPLLLDTLRVCTADDAPGTYNCGRCEKCLRTMVALWIVGALGRSRAFPRELDPARLRELRLSYRTQLAYWEQLRQHLSETGPALAIRQAIDHLLAGSHPTR